MCFVKKKKNTRTWNFYAADEADDLLHDDEGEETNDEEEESETELSDEGMSRKSSISSILSI